ncbi:MAG: hypothetical protein MZV64_62855 [Ignavibacteriales bacterium]|nr:hypothetical protein [Ignavibacteriales bacterium]
MHIRWSFPCVRIYKTDPVVGGEVFGEFGVNCKWKAKSASSVEGSGSSHADGGSARVESRLPRARARRRRRPVCLGFRSR